MRSLMCVLLLACNGKDPSTTDTDTDTTSDTAGDTGAEDTEHAEAILAVQEAAAQDIRRSSASGASVAVWLDGEVIYAEGFGSRHPDRDEPVATTTLFQIGSDTKKLTALAALQQVEAGTLSLESTLGEIVPELSFVVEPGLEDELTLHELLSHQTALFDYTPWTHTPDDAELYDRSVGRLADNEYILGPSGLFWNYSNPNFSLAGLMSQQVDGRLWPDLIEEDIFAPLGMSRSFARMADVADDGDYATGDGYYFVDGLDTFDVMADPGEYVVGTVEMENQSDDAFTRPAGLVWSTATDMAILAGFLVDGDEDVLSDTLREQLLTAHVPLYPQTAASDLGYGYGMMLNSHGFSGLGGFYETPLWTHGGNTLAMTSTFFVLPEQRMAVAILSNGYGDDFTLTAVAAMEGFAELPAPSTATSLLLEPEGEDALAGEWADPSALGTLSLVWDGSALQVSAPDLEAAGVSVGATLQPYARDLYLLRIDGQDRDLSYYTDGDGEWLINRSFSFVRADKDSTTSGPPPASIGARRLPLRLDPRAPLERVLQPR